MARVGRMVLVSLTLLTVAARSAPVTSWGNADVSYDTYRKDAIECAIVGYVTDVKDLQVTKDFVHGFEVLDRQLNGVSNGADYSRNVLLFQPNAHIDLVGAHLQTVVDQCLTDRGYTRFQLSKSQSRQLAKLQAGSESRRRHLFDLSKSVMSSGLAGPSN